MGVFATRSPFRPNPIGLSCVRLEGIRREPELGHVLEVSGADLMDGTPILDIKPLHPPMPTAARRPAAAFTGGRRGHPGGGLSLPPCERVPADKRAALTGVLSATPAPLPARSGAGIRAGLRRGQHPLHRGRGHPHRPGGEAHGGQIGQNR